MPFGISIAPYVCQQLLNAIMCFIRKTIPHAWGHMDDIILAHKDPLFLRKFIILLLEKLTD